MPEPNHAAPDGLACALDTRELAERGATWASVDRHALSRTHEAGVVRTTYPNRGDLRATISDLVEAERACCPFLQLSSVEAGDVVQLVLRYPVGAEATVAGVLPDVTVSE